MAELSLQNWKSTLKNADLPREIEKQAQKGDFARVKVIAEEFAGADEKTLNAGLIAACEYGHADIAAYLLDSGADIHARHMNMKPDYPLQVAACRGKTEVVELLLDRGADIHVDSDQPIRHAALNNHIETAKLLLQRGADLHAGEEYAFMISCANGNLEMAELMLDHGADLHARNDLAWQRAREYKNDHILDMLRTRNRAEGMEKLRDMYPDGLDMENLRDSYGDAGRTMLFFAAEHQCFDLAVAEATGNGGRLEINDLLWPDDNRDTVVNTLVRKNELDQALRPEFWRGRLPELKKLCSRIPEYYRDDADYTGAIENAALDTVRKKIHAKVKNKGRLKKPAP